MLPIITCLPFEPLNGRSQQHYDRLVIVDFHTHIFPPEMQQRDEYLRRDATFAALYGNPKAKLATAEDLLASMDAAGVDITVVTGFAWGDGDLCVRSNDYLLESAANSGGRLIPFVNVIPQPGEAALKEIERCIASGARGLGELRPADQGYALADGAAAELLADVARRYGLVLMFHVSEPVGHRYPGKIGLPLEEFYRFLVAHPDVPVIGAHWGGGLPFYTLMPEVAALTNVYFDTAGSPFLYLPKIYSHAVELAGAERIVFGSDYPLISQQRQRREIEESGLDDQAKALILGENAMQLLKLNVGTGL